MQEEEINALREENRLLKEMLNSSQNVQASLSSEDQMKILQQENRGLIEKLQAFKSLDEELTAKRIYDAAYKRFQLLLSLGGIITVLVGFIGYKSLIGYVKEQGQLVAEKMDSTMINNYARSAIVEKIPSLIAKEIQKQDPLIDSVIMNEVGFARNSIQALTTNKISADNSPVPKDYVTGLDTFNNQNITKPSNITAISIDLSSKMGSVRNQGQEGSSAAFSLSDAMHYAWLVKKGQSIEFSPRYIYNLTRINESTINSDAGMTMIDGLNLLQKIGAIEEKDWPYIAGEISLQPPSKLASAVHYKIKGYQKIPISLQTIKEYLSSNIPVVVGVVFYEVYESMQASKTGILPFIKSQDAIVGERPFCIVGYDDQRKLLKFKNSWGTLWGDKGYGYIHYEDAIKIINEAYIITGVI